MFVLCLEAMGFCSMVVRDSRSAVAGAAIVTAVAFASSYYYWLLIKPRRVTKGIRPGKQLVSVEQIHVFASDSWKSLVARAFYAPFITSVKVINHEPIGPLPPKFGFLSALTEVDLSGNGFEVFPDSLLELKHLKKLSLSRNKLKSLPDKIANLVYLQDLDVGRNLLESVPSEIGSLTKLRFLNLMANNLTELPDEIGQLTSLYRLGLKSNKLEVLPSSMGNMIGLVELFLTDNKLTGLPAEFGNLTNLFKLQASFNMLESLPSEMGYLPNIELFRVAVNNLKSLPSTFCHLDKLSWFSLAGNPVCPPPPPAQSDIRYINIAELQLGEKLGDGASGDVFLCKWGQRKVAFKQFKAETSPDGHSQDEMDISCAVNHSGLIKVLAVVEEPKGLVMDLIAGRAMAEKPNFDSLLRCRWSKDTFFQLDFVLKVASRIAAALGYMHSLGICHGDVYAHNIVSDEDGNAVLCDYGASFFYPLDTDVPYEAQEVRAFGLFLNDIVNRLASPQSTPDIQVRDELSGLVESCTNIAAQHRPKFEEVLRVLSSITQDML